ncbi:1627_t:CDS:2 [Gigaspora margarita]|uniref:1627_t:CDS:1 n=1 Tax=Gigaspora margarita TaxID=4874 RepID=A0ABN7W395_GIGMA|nr:1627_t:CDS:2 [Gigaspora margarita]
MKRMETAMTLQSLGIRHANKRMDVNFSNRPGINEVYRELESQRKDQQNLAL